MKTSQKGIVLGIISLIMILIPSSCTNVKNSDEAVLSNIPDQPGWEMVWHDEFSENTLDQAK